MSLDEMSRLVATTMDARSVNDGACDYGVSGLRLFRFQNTTSFSPMTYRPHVCMVVQGGKDLTFQDRNIPLRPGTAIVISQHLSAISRVSDASAESPYLAAVMPIEMDRLRRVLDRLDGKGEKEAVNRSLHTFPIDDAILKTLRRILDLAPKSPGAQLLGDTYQDEFHALLLLGEAGGDLRRLLTENSKANRVARTIAHIRANLEQGSTIQELIKISGMSKSTLHENFKTATGQTPLQFQKDLRLLEARSHLKTDKEPVSQIAFAVGYSSPTQFARDYKRAFGKTPKQDRTSVAEELI
jgi:AraC-like DNA-binding protein